MSHFTSTDLRCGGVRTRKLLDALRDGGEAVFDYTGAVFFSKRLPDGSFQNAPFKKPSFTMPAKEFRDRAAELLEIDALDVIRLSDLELVRIAARIFDMARAGSSKCEKV